MIYNHGDTENKPRICKVTLVKNEFYNVGGDIPHLYFQNASGFNDISVTKEETEAEAGYSFECYEGLVFTDGVDYKGGVSVKSGDAERLYSYSDPYQPSAEVFHVYGDCKLTVFEG